MPATTDSTAGSAATRINPADSGLSVTVGDDGAWIEFSTQTGKHFCFQPAQEFVGRGCIGSDTVRGWCLEMQAKRAAPKSEDSTPGTVRAAHTPTPWHTGGRDHNVIYPESGYAIANAMTYHGHSDDQANAAFIVRACNSYGHHVQIAADASKLASIHAETLKQRDELLAALRDVVPLLAECDCIHSDRTDMLCPCKAARAAIAKATGAA